MTTVSGNSHVRLHSKEEGPKKCTWHVGTQEKSPHVTVRTPKPKILDNILQHIGNTPAVRLRKIPQSLGVKCEVVVKCEFFNAGGSVKDRIGKRMVEDAERSGRIKPGDTLIEPTSGNTGIGLALAAAVKDYKMIITLPEKMSKEKVDVLKALGAEVIRTPTEAAWDAPESHIGVARKMNADLGPTSHILDQYGNPSNPLVHYDETAEELLDQCDGKIDMIVISAGTGGTLTGIARKLRERLPNVIIIGVDPHGSILAQPETLNGEISSYKVEGIGYDFIPTVLDRSLVDKWYKTADKESFSYSRRLIREEGILCGGSAGSAMAGAMQACLEYNLGADKRCVIIFADSVRNYMSKFLNDDWMAENGFTDEITKTAVAKTEESWHGATIASLNLPTAITIRDNTTCGDCVEILQKGGFDQVPLVDDHGRMTGVVTIGNLLSKIAQGRAKFSDSVDVAAFKFKTNRKYVEITPETKLSTLEKFFDSNAAAFVSEKTADGHSKVTKVVTKVDLLQYLIHHK